MCYVIITGRSLAWLLLSLVAFMFLLVGIMTPKWLLGQPRLTNDNNITGFYVPSVGIYNRCIRMAHDPYNCASFSFKGLATDPSVYPGPWKAAMFFLSFSAAIQFSTVLTGVLACCIQSVFKKSVISLAGATQALGGLFGVLGLVLYPWGWGSARVKRLCGEDSEPYLPGDCSLGWALFVTSTGISLVFLSSALSKIADKAANSDKLASMGLQPVTYGMLTSAKCGHVPNMYLDMPLTTPLDIFKGSKNYKKDLKEFVYRTLGIQS